MQQEINREMFLSQNLFLKYRRKRISGGSKLRYESPKELTELYLPREIRMEEEEEEEEEIITELKEAEEVKIPLKRKSPV